MKLSISVLGAGSWGTALAITLAQKGYNIRIWDLNEEHLRSMDEHRENKKYLSGVKLPDNIKIEFSVENVIYEPDIIVLSVPSQGVRNALNRIRSLVPKGCIIVNTGKGIEKESLMTISQLVKEELPDNPFVVLSGPSHAEEVGKGMPTTLVSASDSKDAAEYIQDLFMSSVLRVYTNPDVIGVELGGALKNIIALAAGISDGLGFGDNAKAALITRGIVEISRLGVAMGACPSTFSGLSGIGDLIVTCTSMHSRNRRCGILIGQGMDPQKAVEKIGMVVEGIYAVDAAYQLSKKYNVEMPITSELYRFLNEGGDIRAAVVNLMTRQKKHEMEETAVDIKWKL